MPGVHLRIGGRQVIDSALIRAIRASPGLYRRLCRRQKIVFYGVPLVLPVRTDYLVGIAVVLYIGLAVIDIRKAQSVLAVGVEPCKKVGALALKVNLCQVELPARKRSQGLKCRQRVGSYNLCRHVKPKHNAISIHALLDYLKRCIVALNRPADGAAGIVHKQPPGREYTVNRLLQGCGVVAVSQLQLCL